MEEAELNRNDDLHHQAEERLNDSQSGPVGSKTAEGGDAMALVHELQVHQIELEMQNEELKHAKLETEDALAKYSDLYDFAPIGLFAFDAQGLVQEVNLVGAALLGVERRNLMKKLFRRFVALKDRPFFDNFCKSVFETSTKQTCELNLLIDGVPTVYAHIEGIAAEDDSLQGRWCRIAVIDITERKWMEEEIHKRTEELVRKNTEMERFIYTISHDLRTPLVSVSGFLGFIEQDAQMGDLEQLIADLRIVNESVSKMDRLLLETLELSRIGRVINPPEDVSFGQIVQEALEQVAASIKSGNVTVSVAQDMPKVHVDMIRIAEVLVQPGRKQREIHERPGGAKDRDRLQKER